jgi:hypothetical protein
MREAIVTDFRPIKRRPRSNPVALVAGSINCWRGRNKKMQNFPVNFAIYVCLSACSNRRTTGRTVIKFYVLEFNESVLSFPVLVT